MAQQREVLLDGDLLPYLFGHRNEAAYDFGEDGVGEWIDGDKALRELDDYIENTRKYLDGSRVIVCLSDIEDNWRYDLFPEYKANRDHSLRPALWQQLRDHIKEHYDYKELPRLEADDVLGMLVTSPQARKRNRIIVSVDKDMLTLPAEVYNPNEDEFYEVDTFTAIWNHMHQTLTGDQVDNYKGCYRIGKEKANKILDACDTPAEMWGAVKAQFALAKHEPGWALTQARVAYILWRQNYDFETQEIHYWSPPNAG